jgi:hypothetical protein
LLGPAEPALAVPLENRPFFNTPHTKSVHLRAISLPPGTTPLAAVYWHCMEVAHDASITGPRGVPSQGARAFFPRRARALAAVGVGIWPLPWWSISQPGDAHQESPNSAVFRAALVAAVRAAIGGVAIGDSTT